MATLRATHASAVLLLAALACNFGTPLRAGETSGSPDVPTWIALLSSDDYDVRSEAAAKLAAEGDAARPALEQALTSSDVETRAIAARLLMQRVKSGLRVMAFDRSGKPLQGIEGTLQVWDTTDRFQRTRSSPPMVFGPNGVAEVDGISPGNKTFNFVWQKCWVVGGDSFANNSYFNATTAIRAGRTPFLFSFSKGGSVKSSVVDADGKPVNEADVALYGAGSFNPDLLDIHSQYQPMQPASSARTDAKGEATIDNIGDGVYVCVAVIHGSTFVGETIRVREGQTSQCPPIKVIVAKPGKLVFAPLGIIDDRNKEEIKTWREQWNQNNGINAADTKAKDKEKKDPKAPAVPELLKDLKLSIDDEFLFEGPDAERKLRAVAEEKARTGRYQEKQQYDADDNGKVTLDNLRVGKHRVTIRCPGFAPKTLTFDIPPGGVADLGDVVFDGGGTFAFKVTDSNGKAIPDVVAYPIPDDETAAIASVPGEVLGFIRGQNGWDEARNYIDWQRQAFRHFDLRATEKAKDKFTLNNLTPGKYSLLVFRQTVSRVQQVYLICGVTVEMGKTTELASLSFSSPATPARNTDSARIKGKLVGITGDLSQRCTVYYQTQNGSTGSSTNTDGTFQLHVGNMGAGGTLRVKVPGFKLVEFDCSKPGLDLNNIEIKLEKQSYGSVRVRVIDEVGRPLIGVAVDPTLPAGQTYYYSGNRGLKSQRKATDAKGEVLFTGLNVGVRRILVSHDGYYISDPVRVTIRKDEEASIVVMLRKGLEISGKVVGPPGAQMENTVVRLQRQQDGGSIAVSANAAGQFSINGLTPDVYTVTAEAPMLGVAAPREVELIGESKRDQDLNLVAKGGFVAQLDPSFKGRYAWLMSKEREEKKQDAMFSMYVGPRNYLSGAVDADGRAEFWGVKPGFYRMCIAPEYRQVAAGQNGEKFSSHIDCARYSEPFEIKEPKLFSELKVSDATKIALPDATASALVKFVLAKNATDGAANNSPYQPTTVIEIKGENCSGQQYLNPRARLNSSVASTAKLRVVGTLPAFLSPKKSTSDMTLIQGLTPGKYKILVSTSTYNPLRGTQDRTEEVLAAEFEIKAGEFKELGTVSVEPSKVVVRKTASRRQAFSAGDTSGDEDLDPAFEP